MTSDPNVKIEPVSAAPFKPGDLVEHGAGVRIVVKNCTLQVQHARTLWIIDGEDGNRYFAKNCKLLERPSQIHPGWKLREDGSYLPRRWRRIASLPGYIEQRQPGDVCRVFDTPGHQCGTLANPNTEALEEIQMEREELTSGDVSKGRAIIGGGTADGERPIVTPLTAAQRAGVDELPIRVKGAAEFIADADLEPGTINDHGEFVGISETTGAAVHATQLKTEIETLAKQRDEAREELKEATAEFVRALSAAHSERDTARRVAEYERASAIGWREVVAKCERLFKMNGRTPTDPNDSAVPLQLDHCLKSLALAEKVIRAAKEVLEQKAT